MLERNVGVTMVISSGYPLSMIVDEKTGGKPCISIALG